MIHLKLTPPKIFYHLEMCGRSIYGLRLVFEDLPGLLLVAELLDALPLQVPLLALFKQRVGSPVTAEEL